MSQSYAFEYECDHCGNEIRNWTLNLDDNPNGVVIPVWTLGQMHFECEKCGAEYGSGDFDLIEFSGPCEDWDEEE